VGEFAELPTLCPWCGRPNNSHAGRLAKDAPADGDLSVCWGCKRPAIFEQEPGRPGVLRPRRPSDAEMAEIRTNPTVADARHAMLEAETVSQAISMYREGGGD